MATKTININSLSSEIQEQLNQYAGTITDKVKNLTLQTAKELTENTKRDAPVRTGDFKRHISYKKTSENSWGSTYTWYVKDPEYRLTHLIANGHAKRNGGRVAGNFPLEKDVKTAENNYIKGIEEIVKNGC